MTSEQQDWGAPGSDGVILDLSGSVCFMKSTLIHFFAHTLNPQYNLIETLQLIVDKMLLFG